MVLKVVLVRESMSMCKGYCCAKERRAATSLERAHKRALLQHDFPPPLITSYVDDTVAVSVFKEAHGAPYGLMTGIHKCLPPQSYITIDPAVFAVLKRQIGDTARKLAALKPDGYQKAQAELAKVQSALRCA